MLDKNLTFGGVFFMSKYSNEFKEEVVKYYEKNHIGCELLARHFNVPNESIVRRWIKRYEMYGIEGFVYKNTKYDGNFKISVVEYMHENHLSLNETCVKFRINSVSHLSKWERIYYEKGPQALYENKRGRPRKMSSKPRKKKLSGNNEKDLIAEVQQLRMENEYLKKLNALVQERIKRESKKK